MAQSAANAANAARFFLLFVPIGDVDRSGNAFLQQRSEGMPLQ
ncbi:MAG: hypothetical protein R3E39_09395 [Anaerolineae bacterium]